MRNEKQNVSDPFGGPIWWWWLELCAGQQFGRGAEPRRRAEPDGESAVAGRRHPLRESSMEDGGVTTKKSKRVPLDALAGAEVFPRTAAEVWLLLVAVSLCTVASSTVKADDYFLAPLPQLGAKSEDEMTMPLAKMQDPTVCQTYLQNLRHFARQNVPMSCERSIAPTLRDRIRHVEMEDMDPHRYPKLFNALTKYFHNGKIPIHVPRDAPDEVKIRKMNSWIYETPPEPTGPNEYGLHMLQEKTFLFRRAKLDLKGYPTRPGDYGVPKSRLETIHIIQFGYNIFDTKHPNWNTCQPVRGADTPSDYDSAIRFYIVAADLEELFYPLEKFGGSSGEYLLSIDGRTYVEKMYSGAEINLLQINLNAPVILEPVCLYTFSKSEPKRR